MAAIAAETGFSSCKAFRSAFVKKYGVFPQICQQRSKENPWIDDTGGTKMNTQVMFFFDTEDYVSPENADAVLMLCRLLEEEGVTGHFAVVGLMAEAFTRWEREDVKAALRRHVIGTHTYGHSMHPDIVEMSDGADFAAARARVMEAERRAVALLDEHLGVKQEELMFATTPGNSISYVGMYCYHELGIPFYCDTVVHDAKSSLMDYCSITQLPYGISLEDLFLTHTLDVDAAVEKAARQERVIFYLHPNMAVKTEFWDIVNFDHENTCPFGEWKACADRPVRETIEYLHSIRMFIRRLKRDERFTFVTLRELRQQVEKPAPVTRQDVKPLRQALATGLAPVPAYRLCVSDVFYAAASFLRGEEVYTPGDVKGFLSEPKGIDAPVTLTRTDMMQAAHGIVVGDFIPSEILVGAHTIGPADFLYAALALLDSDADTVRLEPKARSVDMSAYPELRDLTLVGGTWRRMWEFRDEYVSDRLRLQNWTLRKYGV